MNNNDLKIFGMANAGIPFDDDGFPNVTDPREPVLDTVIEQDTATVTLDKPF